MNEFAQLTSGEVLLKLNADEWRIMREIGRRLPEDGIEMGPYFSDDSMYLHGRDISPVLDVIRLWLELSYCTNTLRKIMPTLDQIVGYSAEAAPE